VPELVDAVVFYTVFLFSVTLHEAGHAWAAKRGGDLTAYLGGQVSIDPLPHIRREPFGMVILPIIALVMWGWPFGYASAPYDTDWARQHPRRAAWMALAGPGANLALVVVAALVIRFGLAIDVFAAPPSVNFSQITTAHSAGLADAAALLISVFFSMNLLLFVLNMIPVPPLDGSGALPLLMSREVAGRYQEALWAQPMLGWIGILMAWGLLRLVWDDVFLLAVNLAHPVSHYVAN